MLLLRGGEPGRAALSPLADGSSVSPTCSAARSGHVSGRLRRALPAGFLDSPQGQRTLSRLLCSVSPPRCTGFEPMILALIPGQLFLLLLSKTIWDVLARSGPHCHGGLSLCLVVFGPCHSMAGQKACSATQQPNPVPLILV